MLVSAKMIRVAHTYKQTCYRRLMVSFAKQIRSGVNKFDWISYRKEVSHCVVLVTSLQKCICHGPEANVCMRV